MIPWQDREPNLPRDAAGEKWGLISGAHMMRSLCGAGLVPYSILTFTCFLVLPRPLKSPCFPMVVSAIEIDTGPCHYIATNPERDLRGSLGRHFTMFSGWGDGYSKWVILLYPGIYISTSIKIPQTLRIFSLFWSCDNQNRLDIRYSKTIHVSPDLVLCLGLFFLNAGIKPGLIHYMYELCGHWMAEILR